MGDRYIIEVECPNCGHIEEDVWFAPTCGADDWTCSKCEEHIDLCEYTGISYEEASNAQLLDDIINSFDETRELGSCQE